MGLTFNDSLIVPLICTPLALEQQIKNKGNYSFSKPTTNSTKAYYFVGNVKKENTYEWK